MPEQIRRGSPDRLAALEHSPGSIARRQASATLATTVVDRRLGTLVAETFQLHDRTSVGRRSIFGPPAEEAHLPSRQPTVSAHPAVFGSAKIARL
jgi:hypothetical protein